MLKMGENGMVNKRLREEKKQKGINDVCMCLKRGKEREMAVK